MRIQNRVMDGIQKGNEIHFILHDEEAAVQLGKPANKMITDSEEMSFVYLFDHEHGYTYVHFPQNTWGHMAKALQLDGDPIMISQGKSIPLVGFKDELTMLIFNIEGNDNYGEAFTSAVEHQFHDLLQNVE
ncbi:MULTISPECIES: hypothetical protein [Sporosarcina]|uniref:Uncharacterized protein n=1 Tax=Sporosarcina contaminans TaxID=633403 RepID=A0ABW3U073_9BACL